MSDDQSDQKPQDDRSVATPRGHQAPRHPARRHLARGSGRRCWHPASEFGRSAGGPAVPAHAVGHHRRPDDAGLGLQARVAATRRLPADAPNILIILIDDVGPAHALDLRRRDQHADARPHREEGRLVQPLPLHGDVLAHARRAADRAQPHPRRQRPDRRVGQRLGRIRGTIPKSSATVAEVLKNYGYNTGGVGQVAQHAGRADHRQGAVRLLADRLRLRVLLRLPRRRGLAVRAAPGAQHDRRCNPHELHRQGLPPHRGHRRGRHQLAARAAGVRPGQAVLHVLGDRRRPTARTTS